MDASGGHISSLLVCDECVYIYIYIYYERRHIIDTTRISYSNIQHKIQKKRRRKRFTMVQAGGHNSSGSNPNPTHMNKFACRCAIVASIISIIFGYGKSISISYNIFVYMDFNLRTLYE